MAPPRKTVKDFEKEAELVNGCLVHPSVNAPRKVYILRHGPLKTLEYVCHKCDTYGCLLDNHVFIGTPKDNTQDSIAKGRHSCFRKGGTRFSGKHTDESKKKIGKASTSMWNKRTDKEKFEFMSKINKKRRSRRAT